MSTRFRAQQIISNHSTDGSKGGFSLPTSILDDSHGSMSGFSHSSSRNYMHKQQMKSTFSKCERGYSLVANELLIPSAHEITVVESIDEWSIEDWIADLCTSNDPNEENTGMNISGSEGEDNLKSSRISELVVLENGNCLPALELETVAVKETTNMSGIDWQEVAMEGNDIIQHLHTLEINLDNLGKDTNHSLVCSMPPSL
ncbi:hypothetical protein L210DRAFT_3507597 [Boletus edulis BED1]|uniref:Uncharacterized protein n=1 Tax=Boletus edulis BED1 TaxID=1328754 RepID=A0AAD4BJA2_BOLED|nr:hypothetical protein L210DRAFT_3507597 [Boletus edulis BED1]